MLDLFETIDQLTMANSACYNGHLFVERRIVISWKGY